MKYENLYFVKFLSGDYLRVENAEEEKAIFAREITTVGGARFSFVPSPIQATGFANRADASNAAARTGKSYTAEEYLISAKDAQNLSQMNVFDSLFFSIAEYFME